MISCGKDDPDDKGQDIINEVTYDGTTYGLADGNGVVENYFHDGIHYNKDFTITDGTVTIDQFGYCEFHPDEIIIYAELFSPGTNQFNEGTFTYSENPQDSDYYFDSVDVTIDSNNDGLVNYDDGEIEATGGSITIEGSGKSISIEYNLTIGTKSLQGNFHSDNFIEK